MINVSRLQAVSALEAQTHTHRKRDIEGEGETYSFIHYSLLE